MKIIFDNAYDQPNPVLVESFVSRVNEVFVPGDIESIEFTSYNGHFPLQAYINFPGGNYYRYNLYMNGEIHSTGCSCTLEQGVLAKLIRIDPEIGIHDQLKGGEK